MSNKLVRRAIETRLAAWATARSTPIKVAYENVTFVPVAGQPYLRVFLMPAQTDSNDLAGAHRVYRGVYQMSVIATVGTGPGVAEGIVDELAALFPLNLRMTVPGLTAQIASPITASAGAPDAPDFIVPVSFQYRADTV